MESPFEKLSSLNNNFEALLQNIELSRKDIYETCSIAGNKKLSDLNVDEIDTVLRYLNIDMGELVKGNICTKTVIAQLNGLNSYLRDSYIGNEGTRLRTFDSALSIVTSDKRSQILRKYQLNEEVLKDKEKLVSVELLKDIFEDLAVYSYSEDLSIIGQINCKKFLDSKFNIDLKKFNTPKEAYIYFIEYCTEVIEKNMDYEVIKVETNRIVFAYKTKESLQHFSKIKHFGNIKFCQNIKGFCEELIKYNYRYPATVNKLSCAHLGSASCTYEIIFDNIVTH